MNTSRRTGLHEIIRVLRVAISATHVEALMTDKPHDSKSAKAASAPRKTESPAEHIADVDGPMSDDAVHKTESKEKHPQGKTRHGGRSA